MSQQHSDSSTNSLEKEKELIDARSVPFQQVLQTFAEVQQRSAQNSIPSSPQSRSFSVSGVSAKGAVLASAPASNAHSNSASASASTSASAHAEAAATAAGGTAGQEASSSASIRALQEEISKLKQENSQLYDSKQESEKQLRQLKEEAEAVQLKLSDEHRKEMEALKSELLAKNEEISRLRDGKAFTSAQHASDAGTTSQSKADDIPVPHKSAEDLVEEKSNASTITPASVPSTPVQQVSSSSLLSSAAQRDSAVTIPDIGDMIIGTVVAAISDLPLPVTTLTNSAFVHDEPPKVQEPNPQRSSVVAEDASARFNNNEQGREEEQEKSYMYIQNPHYDQHRMSIASTMTTFTDVQFESPSSEKKAQLPAAKQTVVSQPPAYTSDYIEIEPLPPNVEKSEKDGGKKAETQKEGEKAENPETEDSEIYDDVEPGSYDSVENDAHEYENVDPFEAQRQTKAKSSVDVSSTVLAADGTAATAAAVALTVSPSTVSPSAPSGSASQPPLSDDDSDGDTYDDVDPTASHADNESHSANNAANVMVITSTTPPEALSEFRSTNTATEATGIVATPASGSSSVASQKDTNDSTFGIIESVLTPQSAAQVAAVVDASTNDAAAGLASNTNATSSSTSTAANTSSSADEADSASIHSSSSLAAVGNSSALSVLQNKEGYLTKQGGKNKNWKRRWFVLRDLKWMYFKKPLDSESAGEIDLSTCSAMRPCVTVKKDFCFEVVTKTRTFYLVADSEEIMQAWMKTITDLLATVGQKPDSHMPKVIKGYLVKQGGTNKAWRKRWFVLQESPKLIRYYKTDKEKEPLGEITLMEDSDEGCIQYVPFEKYHRNFVFEIKTSNRVYVLAGDSATEAKNWVNYLQSLTRPAPVL